MGEGVLQLFQLPPASDAEGKVTVLSMAAQAIFLSCSSPHTSGRAIPGCSGTNKNNPTHDGALRAHFQQPHGGFAIYCMVHRI